MDTYKVGDIVISIAGRDMGNSYIVMKMDKECLYLVDGRGKTLSKPKIKKKKHVKSTNSASEVLARKFTSGKLVQDAEVRKSLKNITLY